MIDGITENENKTSTIDHQVLENGRKSLPSNMISRADFSIWSFLKQCIGKELSKITMPIQFNEPLSFLQRISEYLQYEKLLMKAAREEDPVRRLELVSAFIVSGTAANWDRLGKPFNPLLGETFEYRTNSFSIVCEQVSHHPPVSAFHATSDYCQFYGCIWPKLKFWGKSVEATPRGQLTLKLLVNGVYHSYTWFNVDCVVHNVIVGKLWVEHRGKMRIQNEEDGLYADLVWRPTSWQNNLPRQSVDGFICTQKGQCLRGLYGNWTEYLYSCDISAIKNIQGKLRECIEIEKEKEKNNDKNNGGTCEVEASSEKNNCGDHDNSDDSKSPNSSSSASDSASGGGGIDKSKGEHRLLWKSKPRPENSSIYYNFTEFTMVLNEIDDKIKDLLPPTDCRYRPDIRLMENGKIDDATNEKCRLEEKQRQSNYLVIDGESKQKHKKSNIPTSSSNDQKSKITLPLWFTPGPNHNPKKQIYDWHFNGEYWKRDWSGCPDLY